MMSSTDTQTNGEWIQVLEYVVPNSYKTDTQTNGEWIQVLEYVVPNSYNTPVMLLV
jgi:hypothetical protein